MNDLVNDKFVEVNGLRFHYRDWQPETIGAPALIFLHGTSGHAHRWDTAARAMRDRYHILAIDQRGHGETEWADDYGWEAQVSDLESFVRLLDLSPVTLVGHSLGGFISCSFAALHPDMMRKLVIVDDGPDILKALRPLMEQLANEPDVFDSPDELFGRMRKDNPRPSDSELRHYVVQGIRQRADGKWILRCDPRLLLPDAPSRNGLSSTERWAMLPKITCPTLLLRGAESILLSAQTAEQTATEIPDCALVEIPRAGHGIPLDNPEAFVAALRDFL